MSSAACAIPLHSSPDDRKRPLSVASTTSSSSSSLPRRYRKKFAGSIITSGLAAYGGELLSSPTAKPTDFLQQHPSPALSTVVECSPSDWRLHPGNGESTTRFRFVVPPVAGCAIEESATAPCAGSSQQQRPDVTSVDAASGIDSIDTSMESDDHVTMATTTGSDIVDVCNNKSYVVRRVIEEIIETERSYVRDLGEVVHVSAFVLLTCFIFFIAFHYVVLTKML